MKLIRYFFVIFLVVFPVFLNCIIGCEAPRSDEKTIESIDEEVSRFVNDVLMTYFYDPSRGFYFIIETIDDFRYSPESLEREIGEKLKDIFEYIFVYLKYKEENNGENQIAEKFHRYITGYFYKIEMQDFPETFRAIKDLYEEMRILAL